MKAKKAIQEALKQPWLYNDKELKQLKDKLRDLEGEGVQELWHRRSTMRFSNSPEQLNG